MSGLQMFKCTFGIGLYVSLSAGLTVFENVIWLVNYLDL